MIAAILVVSAFSNQLRFSQTQEIFGIPTFPCAAGCFEGVAKSVQRSGADKHFFYLDGVWRTIFRS